MNLFYEILFAFVFLYFTIANVDKIIYNIGIIFIEK